MTIDWPPPNVQKARATQAKNFWMSHGLTLEQACGAVANEQKESNFKLTANGDRGHAYGVYQHQTPRCQVIYKGCNIDLTKFPAHEYQLDAAWWELTNVEKRALSALHDTTTAYDAGSVLSKFWIRPGLTEEKKIEEADARGKAAEAWFRFFMGTAFAPV